MNTGNSAFLSAFVQSIYNVGQYGTLGKVSLACYEGTMATDAQALNFVPSSFSSQLIATFTNLTMKVSGPALALNAVPANVTAVRAATLTWCALIGQNGVSLILTPTTAGSPGSVILNTVTPALNGTLSLIDVGVRLWYYN